MQPVYVPRSAEEKKMQRALLQYYKPENRQIITEALKRAKPVNIELPGWTEDISNCRNEEELPVNAQRYIDFLEKNVGCAITYVSVGAERDQYIKRTPKIGSNK